MTIAFLGIFTYQFVIFAGVYKSINKRQKYCLWKQRTHYRLENGSLSFIEIFISSNEINVKKIAFGNKEHTTDKKMGVSVLSRLFISSNEDCNTAYAL